MQVVSLKQIVAQLLHASPSFHSLAQPPRLYVPGEISRKNLQMHVHTVLAVSAFNPGAAELGNELVAYLKISGDSHNMTTGDSGAAQPHEEADDVHVLVERLVAGVLGGATFADCPRPGTQVRDPNVR